MRSGWGRQVGQYVLLLVFTLLINFALPRAMPGSPLAYLAGEDVGLLTPEQRTEILSRHGLHEPLWKQFALFVHNLTRGDLGHSYRQGRPVAEIIAERLPWTLLLATTALIIQTMLGVWLGARAAWSRGTRLDVWLMSTFMLFRSMPSFWIAMILLAVFGAQLGWFPMFGAFRPWAGHTGPAHILDILRHLFLPALSLILLGAAETFMTMRYAMLSVLGENYITVARAKGLAERDVLYRHAGRNALLPVATVFMLSLGFSVSGATVIETVFAYPGLGRLMYEAVLSRDYPVLQASFLTITLAVIVANLLADTLYAFLDPRVRI